MKGSITAGGILLLLLLLIVLNTLLLGRSIDDARREVVTLVPEDHAETVRGAYDRFREKERFISLTVSHEDLMSIESAYAELIGAAEAGDRSAFLVTRSRLADALTHLRRLSGLNIDTIL